jgi:hypothetical protein
LKSREEGILRKIFSVPGRGGKKPLQAEVGTEFATSSITICNGAGASMTNRWEQNRPKILMDDESKDVQDNGQPNGRYANYFTVGHNAFEFLFDFGQLHTKGWPAPVHTRIIMTPVYAKSLLGILQESVDQYEQMFGTISEEDQ